MISLLPLFLLYVLYSQDFRYSSTELLISMEKSELYLRWQKARHQSS